MKSAFRALKWGKTACAGLGVFAMVKVYRADKGR